MHIVSLQNVHFTIVNGKLVYCGIHTCFKLAIYFFKPLLKCLVSIYCTLGYSIFPSKKLFYDSTDSFFSICLWIDNWISMLSSIKSDSGKSKHFSLLLLSDPCISSPIPALHILWDILFSDPCDHAFLSIYKNKIKIIKVHVWIRHFTNKTTSRDELFHIFSWPMFEQYILISKYLNLNIYLISSTYGFPFLYKSNRLLWYIFIFRYLLWKIKHTFARCEIHHHLYYRIIDLWFRFIYIYESFIINQMVQIR